MKMAMKRPKTDGRGEAEILDDLDVLTGRQLPEQVRRRDQQDREQHEVVRHAVADRLPEDADGDAANGAHAHLPRSCRARRPTSATRCTKKSSSVSRIGLSDTSVRARRPSDPRARARAADRAAARGRSGPAKSRSRCAIGGASRASTSGVSVGDHELPAAHLERQDVGQPAGGGQPAAGDDRDAAAERLGVGEDVRAEEHRPALVAQLEDQAADVAAAERIEPDIGSSRKTTSGSLMSACAMPDALHHPLRELAELQPALGADADPVEERGDALAAIGARRSRRAARSTSSSSSAVR